MKTNLTEADIVRAMEAIPKATFNPHALVVQPAIKQRLERELPEVLELPGGLGRLTIYTMPNQRRECYAFTDDKLLRKYLNGEVSEDDLYSSLVDDFIKGKQTGKL